MLTIGVSGTVNVTVVPVVGLVLDVSRVDGDTASTLLRRFVNISVVGELRAALLSKDLGDSRGKGGLSVVNVT